MTPYARLRRAVHTVLTAVITVALTLSALTPPLIVAAKPIISVNSSGDGADANGTDCTCDTLGSGTVCTLRAAIQTANACAGADLIRFDAVYTIAPTSALPGLADASGGTTISGRNSGIVLSGTAAGDARGLELLSDGNKVQGVTVTGFTQYNIAVYGSNNVIGTDGDGSEDAIERGVITLSGQYGIYIYGEGNTVAGNYIGVAANGTDKAANAFGGINVSGGSGNIIGTDGDGVSDDLERNVIASSAPTGIAVSVYTTSTPGNTRIAGNYIGTDAAGTTALPDQFMGIYVGYGVAGTVIGTNGDGQGDAVERNVISGIALPGAGGAVKIRSATVVAGNYIGLNAAGTAALPNFYGVVSDVSSGSRIGTNADGVSDALERNVISGSINAGISLQAAVEGSVVVAGNYVGTDATGQAAIGSYRGVSLGGTGDWLIGGHTAAERNVISGNSLGVAIYGCGAGTRVTGNYVGVAADGVTPLPNTEQGVHVGDGAANARIGDVLPGGGNVIAYNSLNGVNVDLKESIAGIAIRGNSIYGNGGPGINLRTSSDDGVTPNDAGDADVGPNGLQNYPVLTAVVTGAAASNSLISGTLNSTAGTVFTLDFYSSDACDPSGNGEGQLYLASTTATTDATGSAGFVVSLLDAIAIGDAVTAVATDANGNSSEFSPCLAATTTGAGAPTGVVIDGPATGFVGLPYSYEATVEADSASFPLTITWYTDGEAQAVRTLNSTGDVQSLTWASAGSKTVVVIVHNDSGSVSDDLVFTARNPGDNTVPVATDADLACLSGSSAGGTLVASDADGDVLTYSLATNGSKGVATITDASSGTYTYVAQAGTEGSDSFTYVASDGATSSNVATVTVTVVAEAPDYAMTFIPLSVCN